MPRKADCTLAFCFRAVWFWSQPHCPHLPYKGLVCVQKSQISGGGSYVGGSATAVHVPSGERSELRPENDPQTMWPKESVLAPEVSPKSPTESFACVANSREL